MFFGKSKQRKSNVVDSPEYNEYIETDNLQDALDLFKRMKKHGFEEAGGMNKLRWSNGTDTFDFKKPFGPGVEAYDIPQEDYDRLTSLLDAIDQLDAMPLNTQDWLVKNPDKFDETISKLGLSESITNAMKKIFNEKLDDLKSSGDNKITVEEYSPVNGEFVKYVKKMYGDGPFTVAELKDIEKNEYDRFFDDQYGVAELDKILSDDEPEDTDVSGLAKSITQQDLGRTFDSEEE